MDKMMKQLFNKMGMEQTSEDFTFLVMNKINPGFVKVNAKKSLLGKYSFILSYLLAFLLVVPFIVPAIKYAAGLNIRFIKPDINIIRESFDSILEAVSVNLFSTGIVISAACLIILLFFTFETITQLRRNLFD